jgi:putative glutamine amidotransferase
MSRPVLGIICCNRSVGSEIGATVMRRYTDAASREADAAILLVPSIPGFQSPDEVAGRLDGILLTGSPSNVAPAHYGDAAPGDGPFDPERDETARGLIAAMTRLGKPVFGICRGFQEINVAFGGTLARDLSVAGRVLEHHSPDEVGFDDMFAHRHRVRILAGGVLVDVLGSGERVVNSVHYQGVGTLADGLTTEAEAEDGVVEAISARVAGADLVAVQWHPEWRTALDDPASKAFFGLLARSLRGEKVVPQRIRDIAPPAPKAASR